MLVRSSEPRTPPIPQYLQWIEGHFKYGQSAHERLAAIRKCSRSIEVELLNDLKITEGAAHHLAIAEWLMYKRPDQGVDEFFRPQVRALSHLYFLLERESSSDEDKKRRERFVNLLRVIAQGP